MAPPDPMSAAFEEARAAGARGEVPVGAAIAHAGAIIARAGNRTIADSDPTAHAEILAIRAAAARLGSQRLVDCWNFLFVHLADEFQCEMNSFHAHPPRPAPRFFQPRNHSR